MAIASTAETSIARATRHAYQDAIAVSASANADEERRLICMPRAAFAAYAATLGVDPRDRNATGKCAQITHPHRRY